jgi:hypothetical protein
MSAAAALKALLAALLATALILLLLPLFVGLLFASALLFYPLLLIVALILLVVAALLPQTGRDVSASSKPTSAPYALLKTLLVIVGSALLLITLLYAITYVSTLFPTGGTPALIILQVSEWVAVAIFVLFAALSLYKTIREWWGKSA